MNVYLRNFPGSWETTNTKKNIFIDDIEKSGGNKGFSKNNVETDSVGTSFPNVLQNYLTGKHPYEISKEQQNSFDVRSKRLWTLSSLRRK